MAKLPNQNTQNPVTENDMPAPKAKQNNQATQRPDANSADIKE